MSTSEPGIPNQAEPPVPSTDVLSPSEMRKRRVVHVIFILALLGILAWKYYLYFQLLPPAERGIDSRHTGASCLQLLLWLFSYGLCISGSQKLPLLILSVVTLFVGVFLVPILGCVGIVIMYLIYELSASASRASAANSSSNPR